MRSVARTRWAAAVAVVPVLCALAVLRTSDAAFNTTTANTGSSFSATTLQPPAAPAASFKCVLGFRSIDLSWTASSSAITTQYRVERSANGGPYTSASTVSYGTNAWTDNTVAASTIYTYRLRAERSGTSWNSGWVVSNSLTTPALCL